MRRRARGPVARLASMAVDRFGQDMNFIRILTAASAACLLMGCMGAPSSARWVDTAVIAVCTVLESVMTAPVIDAAVAKLPRAAALTSMVSVLA